MIDGTAIEEHDVPRGFIDVDATRVAAIDLIKSDDAQGLFFRVGMPPGVSAVFCRRRTLIDILSPHPGSATIYCIGWRKEEDRAGYLFVFEDGSTYLTDDFYAVQFIRG